MITEQNKRPGPSKGCRAIEKKTVFYSPEESNRHIHRHDTLNSRMFVVTPTAMTLSVLACLFVVTPTAMTLSVLACLFVVTPTAMTLSVLSCLFAVTPTAMTLSILACFLWFV
jgi:ABC-type multidrug transport system permease subunit